MRLTTLHNMIFGGLLGVISAHYGYNCFTWQFYIIILVGCIIWFGIGKLSQDE